MNSKDHPHRDLIVSAAESLKPFNSILEVGCNAGPNLARLSQFFGTRLVGIDINQDTIDKARETLPGVELRTGNFIHGLPFGKWEFDVVLSDAVLLYVSDAQIEKVLDDFDRVAQRGIVLCEWDDESKLGTLKNFHWARDYKTLLEERGFQVEKVKITEKDWPTPSWSTYGYVYIARR